MFEKLDTSSIKDRALHSLEQKLLSGEFTPGDRLPPEREIAEEMGVSRSIVSMCMLELEAEGFVKSVPRQGTFVMDFVKNGTPSILRALMNYGQDRIDSSLFSAMMDTRIHIECECARLAAANATAEDIDVLENLLEQMELCLEIDGFIHLDFEFHHALSAASGNAVYAMIVKSFEGAITYFQNIAYASAGSRKVSLSRHRALLDSVKCGDAEKSSELMRLVLSSGVETLEQFYKT